MDALNRVIAVPSWAYDFCWFYFAAAVLVLVNAVWAIWRVFSLPGMVKKVLPVTSIVVGLLVSGGLTLVLAMMQFWICRGALAPKVSEKFAVTCANDGDCAAVMGTQPPGSQCTCGARGFCASCVMNNNMEPAADGLAPIEAFVSMSPKFKKVGLPKRR